MVASSEANARLYRVSGLAEETRETIDRMMEALSKIASATQNMAAVEERKSVQRGDSQRGPEHSIRGENASAESAEHVKDRWLRWGHQQTCGSGIG